MPMKSSREDIVNGKSIFKRPALHVRAAAMSLVLGTILALGQGSDNIGCRC